MSDAGLARGSPFDGVGDSTGLGNSSFAPPFTTKTKIKNNISIVRSVSSIYK